MHELMPGDTPYSAYHAARRVHYGVMTGQTGAVPLRVVVADNVRLLCSRRRVQQAELASCLGMSRMAVSDRFRYRTPWTLDEVGELARIFQVPVAALFGESSTVTQEQAPPPRPTLVGAERGNRYLPPELGPLLPGVQFGAVS